MDYTITYAPSHEVLAYLVAHQVENWTDGRQCVPLSQVLADLELNGYTDDDY